MSLKPSNPGSGFSAPERVVPLGIFGLVFALAAFVLPSALRPPQQAPPTTARLSPDIPADPDTVLSGLTGGESGVVGGFGIGTEGSVNTPGVPSLTGQSGPARSRPCFGEPARQSESLYSPPCAPVFLGNNGGATWRGVSATEIRVAILFVDGEFAARTDGPISPEPRSDESENERNLRVYQAYFNKYFEFYGRQLRLYSINLANYGRTPAGRAAAVGKADTEFKVFAVSHNEIATTREVVRRGIVAFGGYQLPYNFYAENDPYGWSWHMDGTKLVRLNLEMWCKQLVGKPAEYAGGLEQGKPRKFGLIVVSETPVEEIYNAAFEQECGHRFTLVQHVPASASAQLAATVIASMRNAEVTSVGYVGPPIVPFVTYQTSATANGYFPEWLMTGIGETDRNEIARYFYDKQQWQHALGVTYNQIPTLARDTDYYKAYKLIDPNTDPHRGFGKYIWPGHLLGVAGPLQAAGPTLSPNSLRDGLFYRWPKRPPQPYWAVGGGFGPSDYTYADYVALVWWDPTANEPEDNTKGAYRFVYGGQRYAEGEIPTDKVPFFSDGIASREEATD